MVPEIAITFGPIWLAFGLLMIFTTPKVPSFLEKYEKIIVEIIMTSYFVVPYSIIDLLLFDTSDKPAWTTRLLFVGANGVIYLILLYIKKRIDKIGRASQTLNSISE